MELFKIIAIVLLVIVALCVVGFSLGCLIKEAFEEMAAPDSRQTETEQDEMAKRKLTRTVEEWRNGK